MMGLKIPFLNKNGNGATPSEETNGAAPSAKKSKEPASLIGAFPIDYMDGDAIVLKNGDRMAVFELSGVEKDLSALSNFSGMLNALTFPLQLLARQHPPFLSDFRANMAESRADGMTDKIYAAADSLDEMLESYEKNRGIVDRRFYVIVKERYVNEVPSMLALSQFTFYRLPEQALWNLIESACIGRSPASSEDDLPIDVQIRPKRVEVRGVGRRSISVTKCPRTITPFLVQSMFQTSMSMDLSMFIEPIPNSEAFSFLQSKRTRMQAAINHSEEKGRTVKPENEVALMDIVRLQRSIQQGSERLFSWSFYITVHESANREEDGYSDLNDNVQEICSMLAGNLAEVDLLPYKQKEGMLSTMPFGMEFLANQSSRLETTSISLLNPFSPPDMDMRTGTLIGLDVRAGSLITYDAYDSSKWVNMNTVVLAKSGAGKSFATKLRILRDLQRGVPVYVIDPEGEYANMAAIAGGRVLTPGTEGQGLNPFVLDFGMDTEDLYERIGGLRHLIELMIGSPLSSEMRASLDLALTSYYESPKRRDGATGFFDFCKELEKGELADPEDCQTVAKMLGLFTDGSMRFLLSDEGSDLLENEYPITVFDLHRIESSVRPAASMVCSQTIWAMAAKDPRSRLLVVDEVWNIMQHTSGAAFMLQMSKLARKHELGLLVITQDVQDMLAVQEKDGIQGNSGRAMLQNAATKIILQQDPAAVPVVLESCGLPAEYGSYLAGVPRGQGLLISSVGRHQIQIQATEQEAEIIDWDPRNLN